MTCWKSPSIKPGQIWSGYHANVTVHKVIDGTHVEVTILPSQGIPDRFVMTEDLLYNYPDAVHPFSIQAITIWPGSAQGDICVFYSCDIEPAPDEPPSDIIGLIGYVKDKVLEIITTVAAIVLSLTDINGSVTYAMIKIDEAKNLIGSLHSNINYELDVLEIWISGQLDNVVERIINPLELYKKDILDAINTISMPNIPLILEPIKAEIVQMGDKISSKVIEDLWAYIEDQIFEKE